MMSAFAGTRDATIDQHFLKSVLTHVISIAFLSKLPMLPGKRMAGDTSYLTIVSLAERAISSAEGLAKWMQRMIG